MISAGLDRGGTPRTEYALVSDLAHGRSVSRGIPVGLAVTGGRDGQEARPRRNIHDPPRVKLCEGEKHRRNGVLVRVPDCSPAITPNLPAFGSSAVLHAPATFTTGVGAAATRKSRSHIPGIA